MNVACLAIWQIDIAKNQGWVFDMDVISPQKHVMQTNMY